MGAVVCTFYPLFVHFLVYAFVLCFMNLSNHVLV